MAKQSQGRCRRPDGGDLAYEEIGAGPLVVVCHGGPWTDYSYLRPELDSLSTSARIAYWDYRGSGCSGTAPPETYTFEQLADDLDALRQCLGAEDVVVLAHSMGGAAALSYALRHQRRCRALVLISTSPTADLRRLLMPTLRSIGPVRLAKLAARAARYIAVWSWRPPSPERRLANFSITATLQEGRRQFRSEIRRRERLVENDNAIALEREGRRFNVEAQLSGIGIPALVIVGTADVIFHAAARCYDQLANVRFLELRGSGHHPLIEASDTTLTAISQFIGEHRGSLTA